MRNEGQSILRRVFSRLFVRPPRNDAAIDLDRLTRLARRYSVEQQQVPKDLNDLVLMNYLEALPRPPDGLRFVVDRKSVEVKLE